LQLKDLSLTPYAHVVPTPDAASTDTDELLHGDGPIDVPVQYDVSYLLSTFCFCFAILFLCSGFCSSLPFCYIRVFFFIMQLDGIPPEVLQKLQSSRMASQNNHPKSTIMSTSHSAGVSPLGKQVIQHVNMSYCEDICLAQTFFLGCLLTISVDIFHYFFIYSR
jgi:hypothetical protein